MVESNYRIPVTLWVDFEYNHYLISRSGKRVGYLFYWADFSTYPMFDNAEDIPQIRLPVRTEHSTIEEILASFIEAITDYYRINLGNNPIKDESIITLIGKLYNKIICLLLKMNMLIFLL